MCLNFPFTYIFSQYFFNLYFMSKLNRSITFYLYSKFSFYELSQKYVQVYNVCTNIFMGTCKFEKSYNLSYSILNNTKHI